MKERTKEILPCQDVFKKKLKESIIPTISDRDSSITGEELSLQQNLMKRRKTKF
ncbi:MAG: hypothetical protein H3Z50_04405 [archaeon]|nr:hypothetical protein [archaeon]MCP8305663.1 hypothetical protein [archaeon]